MRSSAAILLAVALSATAAPAPKKDTKAIKTSSRAPAPEVLNVWKHRHFDASAMSAQRRDDGQSDPQVGHGDGHWTHSGTWVHSHTGSWSHSHTHHPHHGETQTGGSAPAPTANAGTPTGSYSVGEYPTESPCWHHPPKMGGSDGVTKWSWGTAWYDNPSLGQRGKGWPFPWKKCGTTTGEPSSSDAPSSTETPASSTPVPAPPSSSSEPVTPPTSDAPPASTTAAPAPPSTTDAPAPPVTSQPPPPVTTQAPAPQTTQPPSSKDAQAYLDPHNAARSKHGASPVTWDDNLAALAQQWVNNCNFQHSGGSLSSTPYGENLAAGTGEEAISDAVASWVNEEAQYDYNNPGFGENTGHYTQVVWKATTTIGCAYADCPNAGAVFPGFTGNWRIHSCMYTPPGNVEGEYQDNVSQN